MNPGSLNIDTLFIDDLEEEESCSENGSKRYDEDWSRLVGCQDLRVGDTPLRASLNLVQWRAPGQVAALTETAM